MANTGYSNSGGYSGYGSSNRNRGNRNNDKVEFKIVEYLGILDRHQSGWCREVNIVAWNGKPPKFDIRDWDPDHVRMSRGITLFENEAIRLTKLLAERLQMDGPDIGSRTDAAPRMDTVVSESLLPDDVPELYKEYEEDTDREKVVESMQEPVQALAAGAEPF